MPKARKGWVLAKILAFGMNHSELVLRVNEIRADYISKPVKYTELEKLLKRYIPEEKQFSPSDSIKLPVALIWGYDTELLRKEKARLDGIYKCVPVVGKKSMEKYLENHTPDRIIRIM